MTIFYPDRYNIQGWLDQPEKKEYKPKSYKGWDIRIALKEDGYILGYAYNENYDPPIFMARCKNTSNAWKQIKKHIDSNYEDTSHIKTDYFWRW